MNAVIGSINVSDSSIVDRTHPPIFGTMKAAVAGTLSEGLVLAKSATGLVVEYDPDGVAPLNVPVGVLVHECDTTKDDAAVVLKHGTVVKTAILIGADAADAAGFTQLGKIGIYAV